MYMKSVNCIVCNSVFIPKWYGRNKVCSKECKRISISRKKQKYSKEQIDQVVFLKKEYKTNKEIAILTGVNVNKIKEICKINQLFLPKNIAQNNAFIGKITKNPQAMEDMRKEYQLQVRSAEALEQVKQILESKGFEYVRGFKKKSSSFYIKCKNCNNEKKISRINTVFEDSCYLCSNIGLSKPEKDLSDWISSFGFKVDKFWFGNYEPGGREVDIYIKELQIGIEYCGLYWHNENSPTPRLKNDHLNKLRKTNKSGIRLITIFEDEWRDKRYQVQTFLKSVLHVNKTKIYARNTEVREIDKNEARLFLKTYHIQGSSSIDVAFGLFYENEIIGVMSGGSHHRGKNRADFILNRMAFKDDVSVIGGASKLLSKFKEYSKLKGYTRIVSWSDNRWSEGNVYKAMGFSMDGELPPDYAYVFNGKRMSKQSNTKTSLLKKGAVGSTENEMAQSLKYHRIWDCGKKRWVLPIS